MSFFWKQEFTSPMRITTTLWTRPMKNTVIIAQWCGWELHLHLQKVLWCILVAGGLTSSTVFHKQSKTMWPLKDLSGRRLQLHSIKIQTCISLFILQQHNWSSKSLASSYCKPPSLHPHTYIQVGSHFCSILNSKPYDLISGIAQISWDDWLCCWWRWKSHLYGHLLHTQSTMKCVTLFHWAIRFVKLN